jgi:hypothetical protein
VTRRLLPDVAEDLAAQALFASLPARPDPLEVETMEIPSPPRTSGISLAAA